MAEPGEIPSSETQGGTSVSRPPETKPVVIDMRQGPDGQWEVTDEVPPGVGPEPSTVAKGEQPTVGTIPTEDPYERFNRDANSAWERFQQKGQLAPEAQVEPTLKVLPVPEAGPPAEIQHPGRSPRERWKGHEQKALQLEEEKNLVLLKLEKDGMRLAAIVYTPEGQKEIADTRANLVKIVEAASIKPEEEKVGPGFDRSRSAIKQIEQQNQQMMAAWEVTKEARVDALIRGDKMSDTEVEVYLTQILNLGPLSATDVEEKMKTDVLVAQFAKKRRDIAAALMYQSGEKGPVEQRYLVLNERRLRRHEISILQAQETFAKGWEEVKKRSETGKAS